MTSVFGTSSYGISPYGISGIPVPATVSIIGARLISMNEVDVLLSGSPLATSSIGEGDALNPSTWTVRNADTGVALTVFAVTQIDATTFRLFTLEAMETFFTTYEVGSTRLRDTSGGVLSPPYTYSIAGCSVVTDILPVQQLVDYENLPVDGTRPAGTLGLTSGGDYKMHGGVAFVKKLVIRRLSTLPGGFFHLDSYGIGLRVKEPIPAHSLVGLRMEIQRELQKEPDLKDLATRIQLYTNGTVIIDVRASILPGYTVDVSVEAQS